MKKLRNAAFRLCFMALVFAACIFSVSAADEDKLQFYFSTTPDEPTGFISVGAKNTDISGDIVIPEMHDGKEVKAIIIHGFENCKNITSITIPDTVKTIKDRTFYNCTNLEKITMLGKIENVGIDVVLGTKWYENQPEGFVYLDDICLDYKGDVPENSDLIIRDGTRIIAPSIFYRKNCDVNSIVLPEDLEKIGYEAFWDCGAESVVFGEDLKKIGRDAFGANNISEFIIPDSVTVIGGGAFRANPIKTIKLPESLTRLEDLFGTAVTLPENLHIPKNVSSIDLNMFKNSSAKNFSVDEENQNYWSDGKGLYNKSADTLYQYLDKEVVRLELPDTVKTIPENAFRGFHNLKEAVLSPSMDRIINSAFKDCSALETVVIPEGIEQINESAFAGCTALEKIYIPDSVTTIYEGAFSNCSNLSEVCLPEGLTGLNNIFHECKKLTELHLPKNVCSVQGFVTRGTNYIEKFTVDENNEYLCADESGIVFSKDKTKILCYPTQLKGDEYVVPETVSDIGVYAFEGNHYLKSVVFNENINFIGEGAFHYCENLESFISVPDKVIKIGIGAFDRTKWYNNQPDRVVYFGKVAYTYKGSIGNVNLESIALR
ncbi:MAG: leucine-rich repeat protein, partial [Ruminococcus sp.]|nr:leucine-rich repeat protein [Ruminococcus sp.]